MSGVIASMRRTLLSCISLARNGLISLGATLVSIAPACAGDLSLMDAIPVHLDLTRQEFAVLTTALALLGFSVMAAILLMRTRLRAARSEARLRANIANLQAQADRFRALLLAEPQILVAWPAGDNRPQISGDIALVMPQEARQYSPQRVLAFGTWLPPEPALQMDHAVGALRERGRAIVQLRAVGGLRRELAESNLRYKSLLEETELLRDFAAAAPWPIWAKSAQGDLRYANAAYAKATEAADVADAIRRNLELLESDQRDDL